MHNEHGDELAGGLYAPLLVLKPGRPFDPETDRVFVIGTGGPGAGRGGKTGPHSLTARPHPARSTWSSARPTGWLLDISANEAHAVTLCGPAGPATWRAFARDGWDLAADEATAQPARVTTASGVTRDFELTPGAAGDYALAVATVVATRPTGHVTTVPIRVRVR